MGQPLPGVPFAKSAPPTVQRLGRSDFLATWQAMKAFTETRATDTPDAFWLVEHAPVYTVGIAGRDMHLPRTPTDIPVVRTDRGGQITYHGPGQLVAYLLLDMKRRNLGVRALVRKMENAVIDLLADYGIVAHHRAEAPGVYVNAGGAEAKIAALGLRVKNGCCYHGLALNVDMDLTPFAAINPCGYEGMAVTQLRALHAVESLDQVSAKLTQHLIRELSN